MTTTEFRAALKAWVKAHRRKIIAVFALVALGFAAGAVLAHDKPPPAPAPEQPVVQAAAPHQSRCLDKWKCDHIIASGFAGVIAGRAIDDANKWRWAEREVGCGLTCQRWAACMTPGTLKELSDQHRWRTGSWKDMAGNAIGCAIGLHLSTRF